MPEVIITPLAREDIKNIGRYTQKNWGIKQRNIYLSSMDKTIKNLPYNRVLDRDRSDIRKNLLCCLCQKHMIFFRRDTADKVEILRILGQSMDFNRHL